MGHKVFCNLRCTGCRSVVHQIVSLWQGVLSALQGIKAENTLVIAIFLKAMLLGSSGSIVAARLAQSGGKAV